jgi:pimeloyl-ACP methyl ester carboxylesterase
VYRLLWASIVGLLLAPALSRAAPVAPIEGFAEANGVRLQYLDWGNTRPALILVHGLGDNPHIFDDLAPAFADRFHVIAYSRRGAGDSEARGPYDVDTLTEDLRLLMDALGIPKANFVAHSAGGNEITELAARYPQRVGRIVYLDAGYDWADPDFKAAIEAVPYSELDVPPSAMSSLDAYLSYQKDMWYTQLNDMRRVEASLREGVIVQSDRTVKNRIPKEVQDAHFDALVSNKPRDYAHVHVPVLAIFTQHMYDPQTSDLRLRAKARDWEQRYWVRFQEKSIARLHRELPQAQVLRLPGVHGSFFLTNRKSVVDAMDRFLDTAQMSNATTPLGSQPTAARR